MQIYEPLEELKIPEAFNVRAERALFIHEGIAGSMQIEQILFEYLSVLERIGRAKETKVCRTLKLAGPGNISCHGTGPKLAKRRRR